MSRRLATPGGRVIEVHGDPALVTMDRLDSIGRRLDEDPRIASVSVTHHPLVREGWLRAVSPKGPTIVIANDAAALAGGLAADADADAVVAWAQRARDRGLWHDWFITHDVDVAKAAAFIESDPTDILESEQASSSHFALTDARRRSDPLTITVDATWLGPHETGAQVLTVAAVEALAAHPRIDTIHLTGVSELPPYANRLANVPNVKLGPASVRCAIAWYPNQVDARSDLANARERGRRVVVTYLDLIAYDIPRYHAGAEAWQAYRAMQRRVALSVDAITTISGDVARRLLEEVPRLEPGRVTPIPLGLDHVVPDHVPDEPPSELQALNQDLSGRPFIVVLGNDFLHKNRDFAIATWQEVLRRGVSCDLVLAGLHVRGSSSSEQERALLATHADLRGRVHELDHVSSDARAWLLRNAAAVHYPSSAEGFGFVPYEAASLGTPSTFTDFGPLREIAGASGLPQRWTVDEHANDLVAVMTDPEAAASRLADLRAVIQQRTWSRFANELVEVFDAASFAESVISSAVASTGTDATRLAAILGSRSWRVIERARRVLHR